MNEAHLRQQLTELSAELDAASLDTDRRAHIQALMADIEMQLATGGNRGELRDQLRDAVSSFEAEHPTLAGLLNNIMVTLSSMGV